MASPRPLLTPKPDPDSDAPARLTPELCAALRRELEPSPDDHPDLARHLRVTQQRLDDISAHLLRRTPGARTTPPPASADPAAEAADSSSTAANAKGRMKRARSGAGAGAEMVRATVEADHLHVRTLVRRARLTFQALRGVQRRRREESSSSGGGGGGRRADLRVLSTMLSRGLCLYRDVRIVGPVPGVFVGDAFNYRAELCVVGLHNHHRAGIGYVPASLVSEGHPVATSIVSSGGYLDDHDNGDVLLYTGSGGRGRHCLDHHSDQAFERGNLALAYSCKYGVEVRVVRCHDCAASPSGKVYVYDGLYHVAASTYGPGKSGHDVCQFKLVRLPGQDELGSSHWRAAKELKLALASNTRPRGYITLDLSKGKELLPVPVFNDVDDGTSPLEFDYISRRPDEFPPTPMLAPAKRRCHCGSSSRSCSCVCVSKNGGGPAYDEDGTLIRGRPVVYECGAPCRCTVSCPNRVTQRGMKHRLEVFRSRDTEWGVRTLDLIQPGEFVCEYTGEMAAVDDDHARRRAASSSMDWGGSVDPRRFPERWREWGDASAALPGDVEAPRLDELPGPGYVLDVSRRRNLAAYISHSGAPNVFVQFVIRGNENEACPHLMVFAMDTIPPMRELSIDYGIDQQSS